MAVKFTELSRVVMEDNRCIVISERADDGQISIAQQVSVSSGGRDLSIFLKGAMVMSPTKLREFFVAVEQALAKTDEIRRN